MCWYPNNTGKHSVKCLQPHQSHKTDALMLAVNELPQAVNLIAHKNCASFAHLHVALQPVI